MSSSDAKPRTRTFRITDAHQISLEGDDLVLVDLNDSGEDVRRVRIHLDRPTAQSLVETVGQWATDKEKLWRWTLETMRRSLEVKP